MRPRSPGAEMSMVMQHELLQVYRPGAAVAEAHEGVRLVWADFTRGGAASPLFAQAAERFGAMRVTEWSAIPATSGSPPPFVLCVEVDRMLPGELEPLRRITARSPSLPVLMLAGDHCDELVLEALRARVWDYLAKPVPWCELERRVTGFLDRTPAQVPREQRTASAIALVAERFRERVELDTAAQRCPMSASHFSRVFKREQGMTFSRYLLEYRIRRACDLLSEAHRSVKEVGFDVGFNDAAYFSRTFRRCVGMCPTEYQSSDAG